MLPLRRVRSACRPRWPVFVLLVALVSAPPVRAADEPLPPDLPLVPAGAPAFLCLRVGPYWNGREAEALKKVSQSHPVVVTSIASDLEKATGLPPAELERAVVVFQGQKVDDYVAILTTRRPFDRGKVLGTLVPEAKEAKAGGQTFFTSDKSKLATRVVNDRTLLLGNAEGVRSFLARPAGAGEGALGGPIRAAAGKHLLVVGLVVPPVLLAAVKNAGPQARPFVPLMEAKSWRIVVDADKDLRLNVRMTFASEEAAKAGEAALKAVASPLASYFQFCEEQMPPFLKRESEKYPGVKDLAPRLEKTLQSARAGLKDFAVERKGTTVLGGLRVKTDEPVTAFVLLLSMAPRAAKQ
jgi:hypothetical protein